MSVTARVLIAEDESLIALQMRQALRDAGYEVLAEARTGTEAVRLAASLRPELILMDIRMPEMDGLQAARQIWKARATAIVMVTAYGGEALVEAALAAGASGYLVKPVHRRQLVPAVRLALERFRALEQARSEAAGAREALETRKLVERAKGVLMQRAGLSEAEAFRRLQRLSTDRGQPMKQTALQVLAADRILSEKSPAGPGTFPSSPLL
jgi:AmiR/NasT family two-component response regulator